MMPRTGPTFRPAAWVLRAVGITRRLGAPVPRRLARTFYHFVVRRNPMKSQTLSGDKRVRFPPFPGGPSDPPAPLRTAVAANGIEWLRSVLSGRRAADPGHLPLRSRLANRMPCGMMIWDEGLPKRHRLSESRTIRRIGEIRQKRSGRSASGLVAVAVGSPFSTPFAVSWEEGPCHDLGSDTNAPSPT
mgnify:CR=1 FL=1